MTDVIIKNIIRFIGLLLLQVLILNNIQFSGYVNPYLYVLFILLLPFNTPNWLLIILAFLLGLSVDIFGDTLGLHATASVFMAFCRPTIMKLNYSKYELDIGVKPSVIEMGLNRFFAYSLILVSIHHVILFTLEVFDRHEFLLTFFRIIPSIIFTMLLVIISQYLFYKKRES